MPCQFTYYYLDYMVTKHMPRETVHRSLRASGWRILCEKSSTLKFPSRGPQLRAGSEWTRFQGQSDSTGEFALPTLSDGFRACPTTPFLRIRELPVTAHDAIPESLNPSLPMSVRTETDIPHWSFSYFGALRDSLEC